MTERIIEHPDGTVERITEGTGKTVIERGRGGATAGILIGLALLILVVVGAYFMMSNNQRNNTLKPHAVTHAADRVGDAVDKVGDAATKAADGSK